MKSKVEQINIKQDSNIITVEGSAHTGKTREMIKLASNLAKLEK